MFLSKGANWPDSAPKRRANLRSRSPSPSRSLSPSECPRPSPEPSSRALSPSRSNSRSHSPKVLLPTEWYKQKTPEVKLFYINHTRETTWTPPPPSHHAVCGLSLWVGRQNHSPVQTKTTFNPFPAYVCACAILGPNGA